MNDGISKPTHSDEDRARYEREYERIFGNKPKRIAVTFEHNHSDLSTVWEGYYSKYADVKKVPIGDILRNDWGATTDLLNNIQEELFKQYDIIIFADIDEIIVPDPEKYRDLGEYLDQVKQPVVRCTGYNVIQMEHNKPIDLKQPILKQREFWSPDELYNKYVILTEPQHYTSNHHISNPIATDPNLVMLHLRDIDIDMTKSRNAKIGAEFSMEDFNYRRSIAEQIPEKYRGII